LESLPPAPATTSFAEVERFFEAVPSGGMGN
jgi:hypothetical protein